MGAYTIEWEQNCIDGLTSDIFGFNALQIGMPHVPFLRASRMQAHWCATEKVIPNLTTLSFDFKELPFTSESIDLIVLPHVLEFSSDPHQILREVERVLIPEGHVIILGFNPLSLWGVRQMISSMVGPFLPEPTELIRLTRLSDWLKLMGMEVNRGHFGRYAFPSLSKKQLLALGWLEKAGNRWWPNCGAVYVIQAIKRVKGVHLLQAFQTQKKRAAVNSIPVANKVK